MKYTAEIEARILAAIQSKMKAGGRIRACPLCGHPDWRLANSFITPLLTDDLPNVNLGGKTMPSVAIICLNCGNTHLLNLIILGLGDLVIAEKSSDEANTTEAPAEETKGQAELTEN